MEFFIVRKVRPVFEIYRQCRIAVTNAAKAKPALPYHLRRYLANHDQVPFGYFSILQEITTKLIAPMEISGYTLPANMLPDVSVGLIWCRWLREEKGIDTDSLPMYKHTYEDGRVIPAKLYPIELLPDFIDRFQSDWITNRAEKYFSARDMEAVPHITKMIQGPGRPSSLPTGPTPPDIAPPT